VSSRRLTCRHRLEDAGDSFELIVDAHEALEVFNHPYAYAAFRGCLESADIAA